MQVLPKRQQQLVKENDMRSSRMRTSRRPSHWPWLLLIVTSCLVFLSHGCQFLTPTYTASSPEIERLAIDTSMTPKAQQLFYRQDPKIEPKTSFHDLCRRVSKTSDKTVLLGCFSSNGYQGNIYIQQVTDPRLAGTMEVAAAHEMLHAAYQDLREFERTQLIPKLQQAAKRVKDPRLLSVLERYEKGRPDIYVNELHSHLGTEVGNLGDPDLEKYYLRYFGDRQQVVTLAQRSQKTLNELEAQAEELKPEIDALEASLKQQSEALKQLANELDSLAESLQQMKADLLALKDQTELKLIQGDSSLVSQFELAQTRFNTQVDNYNTQVQEHQTQVAQFNQQVSVYEQKVKEYNQIAQTERSILSSIRPDAAPETEAVELP
jgi:hypothetical protein